MKEKLYLIKNDVNDLKYVGQTFRTLEARFKEHCYDDRSTSTLHAAIKEIGPEHFTIELLEEVSSNQAYNRKRTYIEKYNTIRDGYNPHITLRDNNIHEQVMIEGTDIENCIFGCQMDGQMHCTRDIVGRSKHILSA